MENIRIDNQTITNQTLVFESPNTYFLGGNLILRNCELIIKVTGKNFRDCGVEFHNCTFVFRKKLVGKRWDLSKFFNCKFIGEFGGNIGTGVFGYFREGEEPFVCELRDCDFSACVLNGVRFINTDMSTLILPRWPCFTIFNAYHHLPELTQVKGWGIYGSLFFSPDDIQYFGNDTGLSLCVSNLSKRYDVDEQLLYRELSALDFVYL